MARRRTADEGTAGQVKCTCGDRMTVLADSLSTSLTVLAATIERLNRIIEVSHFASLPELIESIKEYRQADET